MAARRRTNRKPLALTHKQADRWWLESHGRGGHTLPYQPTGGFGPGHLFDALDVKGVKLATIKLDKRHHTIPVFVMAESSPRRASRKPAAKKAAAKKTTAKKTTAKKPAKRTARR